MKLAEFAWPEEFDAEPSDEVLPSVIATLGVPARATWDGQGGLVSCETEQDELTLDPDLPWQLFCGQTGGNACNHPVLIAIGFSIAPGMARALDAIARRWLGSQVYFPHLATLGEVLEYARQVEALGLTCDTSYRDFHEALYPLDPTPGNLARLGSDPPPNVLSRIRSRGTIVPWRLWIWGPNSD